MKRSNSVQAEAQNRPLLARVQSEVDAVMGGREIPTYEDVKAMQLVRLCFAESLRMHPTALIRATSNPPSQVSGASTSDPEST